MRAFSQNDVHSVLRAQRDKTLEEIDALETNWGGHRRSGGADILRLKSAKTAS
jgi:hypothetical protein